MLAEGALATHSVGDMVHMELDTQYSVNFLKDDGLDESVFETYLSPKLQAFAQQTQREPFQMERVENGQIQYVSGKLKIMAYQQPGSRRLVIEFNTYDDNADEIVSAETQDTLVDAIEAFLGEASAIVEPPPSPILGALPRVVEIIGESSPTSSTLYKKFKVQDTGQVFVYYGKFKAPGLFTELVNDLKTTIPGEWSILENTIQDFSTYLAIGDNGINISMVPSVGSIVYSIEGIVEIEGPITPATPTVDSVLNILNTFFARRMNVPIGAPPLSISRSFSGDTQIAQPLTPDIFEPAPGFIPPIQVFESVIEESALANEYNGKFILSARAQSALLNPEPGSLDEGVLTEKAVSILQRKLDEMADTLVRLNINVEPFYHMSNRIEDMDDDDMNEIASDEFYAYVNDSMSQIIVVQFQKKNIFVSWKSSSLQPANIKQRIVTILRETLKEIEGPVGRQLDFGEAPVDNRALLKGPTDKNLKFYETLAPSFSFEEVQATPLPINNTVFDQEMNEDAMLSDFVLPGGKLVFLYSGKQTGLSYAPLMKKIREGEGIFYECIRVFPFNPNANQMGTFEYNEIYAQPYIELALTARFYIPLEDFEKLLRVPVHPYWEIKDTGKTLKAAASRSSVMAGGPIMSQLHCQDGSDLKVYTLTPYMPTQEAEEEEAPVETPKVVTLQRGEDRMQVDISQNNTVLGAKTWYAAEKGLTVSTMKFIFMGKILKDEDVLTPGTVVQVMGGQGGRRTYRRRKATNKRKSKK